MTQNARVALFVPSTDTSDPGEIIECRGTSGVGRVIPTIFNAQAGSSGSVGEAPVDGKAYARQSAAWAVSVIEAPSDGQFYARKDAGWLMIPPFPEAPSDGKQYARQNANWSVVTPFPTIIDGGVF